jgi:hypothetical protein
MRTNENYSGMKGDSQLEKIFHFVYYRFIIRRDGGMVDTRDLKSLGG